MNPKDAWYYYGDETEDAREARVFAEKVAQAADEAERLRKHEIREEMERFWFQKGYSKVRYRYTPPKAKKWRR